MKIRLYTTENCLPCQQAYKLLAEEFGFEVEKINITGTDHEFLTRVPQISWPDGAIQMGFRPHKVRKKARELKEELERGGLK